MKKFIIAFLATLMVITPYSIAATLCDDVVLPNTACEVNTPVLICGSYTYDMYAPNRTKIVTGGSMTQIGTSGMYNFTFNQASEGAYQILLCDNTTAQINVGNTTDVEVWNYQTRGLTENVTVGSVNIGSSTITSIAQAVWEYQINIYNSSTYVNTAGWFLYWILTQL